ncbi:MAG: hypothetical protein ACO1N5_01505 [Noviherbaspirillum sp.]
MREVAEAACTDAAPDKVALIQVRPDGAAAMETLVQRDEKRVWRMHGEAMQRPCN